MLVVAYTAGPSLPARAARPPPLIQPQPLRLRISDLALQLWIEEMREKTRFAGSDETSRREVFGLSPTASLSMDGSVYHPNLLRFSLRPEIGYAWYDKRDDALDPSSGSETTEILNYSATATLLAAKPYALNLLAEHQRTVRHDDFFTRQEVDGTFYSARSGYVAGPVPLTLAAGRRENRIEDFRVYETREKTFSAGAHNNRGQFNTTVFDYTFEEFSYIEEEFTDSGTRHTASLSDREVFDAAQKYTLNSDLRYDETSRNDTGSESLTLREDFRVHHTPHLDSEYDYQFSDNRSGESEGRSHELTAALHHQLYESLTSSADVDGAFADDSGPDSSSTRTRYGAGFGERYTKKLPSASRLTLDAGARYSEQNTDASGSSLAVVDEVHVLTDGTVTFLNLPDVDPSSIVVTDSRGIRLFREGLDYLVFTRGRSTQIERIPGGQIPNGSSVRVSYHAGQAPSDTIATTQHNYGFRVDLWNRLLGIYARRYEVDSSGDFDQSVQNVEDLVAGLDSTYRKFRAGIEYEDYRSNLSSYTAWRAFQSLILQPSRQSTVSLDARQQRSHFENDGDDQDLAAFIARYDTRPFKALALRAEAGAQFESGIGPDDRDRRLYTARTSLDYWIGRVTMRLAYEYQNSEYVSDKTERHLASLRMQRKF